MVIGWLIPVLELLNMDAGASDATPTGNPLDFLINTGGVLGPKRLIQGGNS